MDHEIRDGLEAIVRAPEFVRRYPLFVHVLGRMHVLAAPQVEVMAVSAWGDRFLLHVNPSFFERQPQYVPGVLLHELHHVVLGHVTHPKFREPRIASLMNLAMEVSANEHIVEPLPGHPVTCERLKRYGIRPGQSTMERYHALVRAVQELNLPARIFQGSFHAPLVGPLSKAVLGGLGGVPGRQAGDLIERLSGDGLPSLSVDWRAELASFVGSLRVPQPNWLRPPRRFPHALGIVPGRARALDRSQTPSLLVAIDTSGSMTMEELEMVGAELQRMGPLARMTLVHCDTKIQRVHPFEGRLPEIEGRGGTDLRPPFASEFLAEHRPDGVVYFTDGAGPWPELDPRVPTLWVLTCPVRFDCPWGRKVTLGPPRGILPPEEERQARRRRRPSPATIVDDAQEDLPF